MSERAGHSDPHAAVKRDVLVRYLDAWIAGALRSHRRATYVECGGFAADVFGVFEEFADRIEGHHLEVVLAGTAAAVGKPPAGVVVRTVADLAELAVDGPMLAHVEDAAEAAGTLARGKAHEVLFTVSGRAHLPDLRPACTVTVELVADDGAAQLLVFATGDQRHLATFKNELWAVDEFAGIRYRDPHDAEGALVDISLTPQLLPLRRVLLAELARRGRCTVADLQRHTLLETIYRPADAIGALTSAATAGVITRDPAKGRLTPRTTVAVARA